MFLKKKFWLAAVVFAAAFLQMGMVALANPGDTALVKHISDGDSQDHACSIEAFMNDTGMSYSCGETDPYYITINKVVFQSYLNNHGGNFEPTCVITPSYSIHGYNYPAGSEYDVGVSKHVTCSLESQGMDVLFYFTLTNEGTPDDDPVEEPEEKHESAKDKHHNDTYEEYTYKEVNGQLEFGGMVNGDFASTSMIPASAYPKFNDWAVKKLEGLTGFGTGKESSGSGEGDDGRIVIKCGAWNSFPEKVMQAINGNEREIELIYRAADGQLYSILISSGSNVLQYVDENGYCGLSFLGSKLGQTLYVGN